MAMKSMVRMACALLAMSLVSSFGHGVSEDMAEAAKAFLSSLSDEQKAKAQFDFKSDERFNWHFVPKARKGLSIKEMRPHQRTLAHALLSSGMSHRGFFKAS